MLNAVAANQIANSDALPWVPVVALEVLELCRQDSVNPDDVAVAIEKDPALTAKILKTANSSMFGRARNVATVSEAMGVLGLRTVRIMVLGFALAGSMNSGVSPGLNHARYLRRSVSTAAAAWLMADATGNVRADEAFIGGLLCDIGMMAAERHAGGVYSQIERRHREGEDVIDLEREILGESHAVISALLLSRWCLPEVVCQAVAAHHGDGFEELGSRAARIAAVLWAASQIADSFCGEIEASRLDVVKQQILTSTGLSQKKLEEVLARVNDQVRKSANLFELDDGAERSHDEFQQAAMLAKTQF